MSWQDVPFYAAAFAFGLVGWVIGGYFTLLALASLGLPVQAAIGWPWEIGGEALLSWLIPLGVSALEVGFARRARGWPLVVFILVAGIDFISTVIGVHVAYADQQVFGVQLAAAAFDMGASTC